MNIKDHITGNREKLDHDIDLKDVWAGLEVSTTSDASKSKKGLFVLLGILTVLFLIYLILSTTSHQNEKTTATEKPILFAKFDAENSADRAHLLNETIESEEDELKIANALIYVVEQDESLHVKLSAARALAAYADIEDVRLAIIDQVVKANEDYLKITLIKVLTDRKIKDGIPALDQLLADDKTAGVVKREAQKSKQNLKKI